MRVPYVLSHLVGTGDYVKEDEVIAEVETDKVCVGGRRYDIWIIPD